MRILSVLLGLLACACSPSSQARGEDQSLPENLRRYSDGPLQADDFRGTVPDPRPRKNGVRLEAFTSVDIRYNVRYRSEISGRRTKLTLTSIDVFAVFDRTQSWIVLPADRELMDHEQGHFDLAAIYAMRMQLDLEKRLDDGRGITTVGADEKEAALAMRQEIDRLLRTNVDEMVKANQQYDRLTAHGTRRAAQRRERKKQRDELSRLVEKLRPSKPTVDSP